MAEKTPAEQVMEAFNELKVTNDQNEKRRDAVLDEKLNKINATLDQFEDLNKKATLAADQAKATQEQVDRVEAVLNKQSLGGGKSQDEQKSAELRQAFNRVLRKPADARDAKDMQVINDYKNTLIRGDDAGAGYLLAPPDMVSEIIKDIIEITPMRSLATVRTIGSSSLKQPKRTGTAAATRVGEQTARSNTGDPAYGMLDIPAPELFARAEISMQMLEDSDYDLEAELRSEFSEQFALTEGTEFLSGNGDSLHAEGLLVNSGVGSVKSGDATKITADGLIDLYHELKTGYVGNARFLLNRKSLRDIRKLKDLEGQYLWTPGIAGSVPNTILGASYVEMPGMPDIGAGAYPVVFGDIRRAYIVVDRVVMSFQSDWTTGADNGVVVYRARKRVGGGVRQADAVKKLLISA